MLGACRTQCSPRRSWPQQLQFGSSKRKRNAGRRKGEKWGTALKAAAYYGNRRENSKGRKLDLDMQNLCWDVTLPKKTKATKKHLKNQIFGVSAQKR